MFLLSRIGTAKALQLSLKGYKTTKTRLYYKTRLNYNCTKSNDKLKNQTNMYVKTNKGRNT